MNLAQDAHAPRIASWILSACLTLACVGLALQWKTIKELRDGDRVSTLAASPVRQKEPEIVQEGRELRDERTAKELAELSELNAQLSTRVKQLEARIAVTEPFMPGHEDPNGVYVGPGTWIPIEQQGPVAKVSISGSGDDLRVKLNGDSAEVAWDEAPLERITNTGGPKSYWRGIAMWESLDSTICVMVTFEKQGLRVDWLRVPKPGKQLYLTYYASHMKSLTASGREPAVLPR